LTGAMIFLPATDHRVGAGPEIGLVEGSERDRAGSAMVSAAQAARNAKPKQEEG